MAEEDTDTVDTDPIDQPDVQEALAEVEDTLSDEGGVSEDAGTDQLSLDTDETYEVDPVPDTPAAPVDLQGLMGELGLGEKYQTPEDAIRGLSEAQKFIGQRDHYAEIGRKVEPHMEQFEQYVEQTAQPSHEPAWNPPQYYDDDMHRLETLAKAAQSAYAQGDQLPAWESLPEPDKERVVDYINYRENFWQKAFNHPEAFVQEVVFPNIQGQIEEMFLTRDRKAVAQDFVHANKDLLQSPETYRRLDQLMSPEVGVPGLQAAYIVRLESQLAALKNAATGQVLPNKTKASAKRRLSSRGGRPGKQPSNDIDVDNMSYDDIADHVLQMEAAGALPDVE